MLALIGNANVAFVQLNMNASAPGNNTRSANYDAVMVPEIHPFFSANMTFMCWVFFLSKRSSASTYLCRNARLAEFYFN